MSSPDATLGRESVRHDLSGALLLLLASHASDDLREPWADNLRCRSTSDAWRLAPYLRGSFGRCVAHGDKQGGQSRGRRAVERVRSVSNLSYLCRASRGDQAKVIDVSDRCE